MNLIESAIKNAYSVSLTDYESIIRDVIEFQTEKIYEAKMHSYIQNNYRLDEILQKDFILNKKLFNSLQKTSIIQFGLITEAWCMDACNILPLFRAIEIANHNIKSTIFLRDRSDDFMNLYLTNGSKSIPIVFGIDAEYNEIFRWGPRSQNAMKIFLPLKDEPYNIKSQALEKFYLEDKTASIQEEWLALIK